MLPSRICWQKLREKGRGQGKVTKKVTLQYNLIENADIKLIEQIRC